MVIRQPVPVERSLMGQSVQLEQHSLAVVQPPHVHASLLCCYMYMAINNISRFLSILEGRLKLGIMTYAD